MNKIVIVIGVCLLSTISFFSGCVNIPEELTQFSIMSFDVEPSIINQGEYANLSWIVLSASSVTIDNGIGNVALTGHRMIQPTQTTTYTLTASNKTTTKNVTATITVIPVKQTPNQTPNIACTTDSTTNRIQIATADENIKWRDIVITTDSGGTWEVFNANGDALAPIGNTTAINTDVIAGDYILILDATGNVRVTLKYTPTNSLLGTWTVNV